MKYLTCRLKQTGDTSTYALSAFFDDVKDANAQYWNMVAGDIKQANVTEFTDFVIDTNGGIGNIRNYSRIATADELKRWYYIMLEIYTEESGKEAKSEIYEFSDRDSAEIAFCKDNATAEKNADILTAAHFVVNHHGGKEFYELYDNRPKPEPETKENTEVTGE